MLTLDTELIKDNQKIICKYYELEDKCREITTAYCMLSEENRKYFEKFSSNYSAFRPYFDFVLCKLGYKLLNPQMELGKILIGNENHMYVYKIEGGKYEENFRYGLCDDKTLNIYPMSLDSSTYHDCIIYKENNHLLPSDMYGHVQILQQLLNILLISNKKICEEYLKSQSDIGTFVSRFLPIIRFQADKQGNMILTRCVYRSDNITDAQSRFISDLLDNRYTYPSFLYDISKHDLCHAVDLSEELTNSFTNKRRRS